MVTTAIGSAAEAAVAKYLAGKGFSINDRNWRTKICEIDIVASRKGIVYFVEVKYRSRSIQSGGFDYIGPSKLKQLEFAARVWAQTHKWDGDCRIIGAEVSGGGYESIELVEIER